MQNEILKFISTEVAKCEMKIRSKYVSEDMKEYEKGRRFALKDIEQIISKQKEEETAWERFSGSY